jgi:hypothetical protein
MIIFATLIALSIILFQIGFDNLASAIAVPLIPINSGNSSLDNDLPKFFSCIKKAVKESVNAQEDPYFKTEPTKEEVVKCYHDVIVNTSIAGKVNREK